MKAKSIIDLLTLSTNLYMISKDEEFMHNMNEMLKKGKEKVTGLAESLAAMPEEGDEKMISQLVQKAKEAREQLESRIELIAEKVYAKLHIAHTQETTRLAAEIEKLKRELALAESRILHLEQAARMPQSH